MLYDYRIFHNGSDATNDLKPVISSMLYVDNTGLVSDRFDVTLKNDTLEYIEYFSRGDQLSCEFLSEDRRVLKTGKCTVDTISGGLGARSPIEIGSVSSPIDGPGFSKRINYTSRRVKLKTLLHDILKRIDMQLLYQFYKTVGVIWDIELRNVSEVGITVGELLSQLAETFGCFLKIVNNKVVFGNKSAFALYPVSKVFTPGVDVMDNFQFDIRYRQDSEYDIQYYNPRTGKVTKDKKNSRSQLVTKNDTVRRIVDKVTDPEMARAIALSVDNQIMASISFDTIGDPDIIAGNVIQVNELLKLSGRYVNLSTEHSFDRTWTASVEAINLF